MRLLHHQSCPLPCLILQNGSWLLRGPAIFPISSSPLRRSPFASQDLGQLLQLRFWFCTRVPSLFACVSDDLGLFFTKAHVIGGSRLAGGDLGQDSFFLTLTQLQIEELTILLDVIQPLGLEVTKTESRRTVPALLLQQCFFIIQPQSIKSRYQKDLNHNISYNIIISWLWKKV